MADPVNDLWGDDFPENREDSDPVIVLKEQAHYLRRRTAGRVEGEVLQSVDGGTVWCSLYAKVPSLGSYRFKLVSCAHALHADPADPYPVKAVAVVNSAEADVGSHSDFTAWLQSVLSSPEVHKVIGNLMRYADDRVAS